jgi:hypothetical protein
LRDCVELTKEKRLDKPGDGEKRQKPDPGDWFSYGFGPHASFFVGVNAIIRRIVVLIEDNITTNHELEARMPTGWFADSSGWMWFLVLCFVVPAHYFAVELLL